MRSTQRDAPATVLGRATALLDAFRPTDTAVTLAELARRTGLPKPTAHRLAHQLLDLALLESTTDGLRLGLHLFELGQLVPRQRGLRDAARPYLDELRQATGETVHLAILEPPDVVYLEKLAGTNGPPLPSRVGGRMPAHCTAVGKVLLAHAPPPVRTAVLAAPLVRRTARTIVMPGLLARELTTVRETGLAYEHEESAVGVVCAAAPLIDSAGVAVAALSLSGWSNRLVLERVTPALRTAARLLSRTL